MQDSANHLSYSSATKVAPDFFSSWDRDIGYEPVGGGGIALGSRLLHREALTTNLVRLQEFVQNVSEATNAMQVHLIANRENRGLDVALNPA